VDNHEVQGWCWGYVLARPDGTSMLYLHSLEGGRVLSAPWYRPR
jgi:hypothetical protein